MSEIAKVVDVARETPPEVFEVAETVRYTVVVPSSFGRQEDEDEEQRAERYFLEVGACRLPAAVEEREVYGVEPRDGAGNCVACESGVCGPDCPLQRARQGLDPYSEFGREVRVLVAYSGEDFWVVVDGHIASIFYGDEFRDKDALSQRRLAGLYEAVGLRPKIRVLDLTERLDRMVFGPDGEPLGFVCESEALESLLLSEPETLWEQAVDPGADEAEAD